MASSDSSRPPVFALRAPRGGAGEALPAPPVSGRSGGSRRSIRRESPIQSLDADPIEIKKWIARNVSDPHRSTGDANIDAVFGKVPAAPDHQSGDNLQPEELKPSCPRRDTWCSAKYINPILLSCSEVGVVNSNSGTMVHQSSSDLPTDVDESVINIAARVAEVIIVTAQIKSFAELHALLDEQFCQDNTCEDTLLNIDLFLSNTPHFFTIVLNWLGRSESQGTLSEFLAGITSPVDTGFFCQSANSSTMYSVTSMICCADESYVYFARDDKNQWLIYDFATAKTLLRRVLGEWGVFLQELHILRSSV